MAKQRNRRRALLERQQKLHKRREAASNQGDRTTVFTQSNRKGYNVELIRDFLDQLLLELRSQVFEDSTVLKKLDQSNDINAAIDSKTVESQTLIEQFTYFHRKYETALIASTAIDGTNATPDEMSEVTRVVLVANIKRRDEQLGHLEALQELFDEALLCANTPFGKTADGEFIQPLQRIEVRAALDDDIPDYDELLPSCCDHLLASDAGIEQLKSAKVIVANDTTTGRLVLLFGHDVLNEAKERQEERIQAFSITVSNREQLVFALAALMKFKGRHEYAGDLDLECDS